MSPAFSIRLDVLAERAISTSIWPTCVNGEAHEKLRQLYRDQNRWARGIINVASRKVLKRRTITQYAAEIWNVVLVR